MVLFEANKPQNNQDNLRKLHCFDLPHDHKNSTNRNMIKPFLFTEQLKRLKAMCACKPLSTQLVTTDQVNNFWEQDIGIKISCCLNRVNNSKKYSIFIFIFTICFSIGVMDQTGRFAHPDGQSNELYFWRPLPKFLTMTRRIPGHLSAVNCRVPKFTWYWAFNAGDAIFRFCRIWT